MREVDEGPDRVGGSGARFVIGLLAGTVIGVGLGMLFAPKAGSELRNQIAEQAGTLADNASEQYRRAQEAVTNLADRGREVYGKVRGASMRTSASA